MAPILIFGYGNPSRGDDALGPALIQRLERHQAARAAGRPAPWELLTDFQPQPEHALDLVGRARVILVDADVSLAEPYRLAPVIPDREASYTTHAMSPGALLRVHTQIGCGPAPPCLLLRIRGYHFALGAPLSAQALANLVRAEAFLVDYLGDGGA